ncbi:MAG: TIGR04222 domain-containing membrane protein [Azospirillum sp.]|nr:TIGR04222 domain-containing membrane protein [Azospirillum sp.]
MTVLDLLDELYPFTLRGPEFLQFYLGLGLLVVLALWIVTRGSDRPGTASVAIRGVDPYEAAYLRSGRDEAIKVAVFSLADRGLLVAEGGRSDLNASSRLVARAAGDKRLVNRPFERAVLEHFASAGKPATALKAPAVREAAESYHRALESRGLVCSHAETAAAGSRQLVARLILVGVSALRIGQALAHGRYNLMFLVLLTVAAWFAVGRFGSRRLTSAGRRQVASLRNMLTDLRKRSATLKPGGSTNEAALLAAVFGFSVLSAAAFPAARAFSMPQSEGSSGFSSDSGCSSSCGSSCGGGCGGGCGG